MLFCMSPANAAVPTPSADLPDGIERLPLKLVATNQVPMVAPAATLRGVHTARIGLDPERCDRHRIRILRDLESIQKKVAEVYSIADGSRMSTDDPDRMLYGGPFFGPADRSTVTGRGGAGHVGHHEYGRCWLDLHVSRRGLAIGRPTATGAICGGAAAVRR